MFSQALKSHWILAFRSFKKAIKVTLDEIKQIIKAKRYIDKVYKDNREERIFWEIYDKKKFIMNKKMKLRI